MLWSEKLYFGVAYDLAITQFFLTNCFSHFPVIKNNKLYPTTVERKNSGPNELKKKKW